MKKHIQVTNPVNKALYKEYIKKRAVMSRGQIKLMFERASKKIKAITKTVNPN